MIHYILLWMIALVVMVRAETILVYFGTYTGGESTGIDIIRAAERARDAQIKLFCIGVGK